MTNDNKQEFHKRRINFYSTPKVTKDRRESPLSRRHWRSMSSHLCVMIGHNVFHMA
jgi:hypothetical protein